MQNQIESPALDVLTASTEQPEQPTEPKLTPDPKCPRCGRSVKGKLIHLITPDQIMHTFLCGHNNCQSIISLQVDFMTMHSQMMQAMGVGADQGLGQGQQRTPGGIILPGN